MRSALGATALAASLIVVAADLNGVAADAPLPVWVSAGIAAFVGAALGYSDGSTLPGDASGVPVFFGIAATVFAVFALLAGLALSHQSQLARLAMRVSGSWIAAAGLLLLGWSLRGALRVAG